MEKQRWWSLLTSNLFLLISLVALIIIITALVKGLIRRQELDQEIAKIKNDIAVYQTKQEELTNLITYLQSAEFKEKEARLKFNLKKPDEKVVVLPGQEISETILSETTSALNIPNWQKWWNYFFNK